MNADWAVAAKQAREVFTVKDSGKREAFETGAQRDTQDDKPRPDLISPFALTRVGVHMAKGAIKYNERNWEKGIKFSRMYASALRHLLQWGMGMRDEDHLAAVAFNVNGIMHYEAMIERRLLPKTLDDMPQYTTAFEYQGGRFYSPSTWPEKGPCEECDLTGPEAIAKYEKSVADSHPAATPFKEQWVPAPGHEDCDDTCSQISRHS